MISAMRKNKAGIREREGLGTNVATVSPMFLAWVKKTLFEGTPGAANHPTIQPPSEKNNAKGPREWKWTAMLTQGRENTEVGRDKNEWERGKQVASTV